MSRADTALAALLRTPFYKMTGSGNDFVFLDARSQGAPEVVPTGTVLAICARGTGVGADGLVVLDQPIAGQVRIAYYNSDGTRASLCGNATLCTASLARHLGAVPAGETFRILTDAGALSATAPAVGDPAFELEPVRGLVADAPDAPRRGENELRIGFALAGVPHLVVLVSNLDNVPLTRRGAELRRAVAGRPHGANVNFVAAIADGLWGMRTFERGVEGETLACGTGAVACAAVLRAWGLAGADGVVLRTRSGRDVRVRGSESAERGPSLSGEGRLVFVGRLSETILGTSWPGQESDKSPRT